MLKKTIKPALPFYERCLALAIAGFFIFTAFFNLFLDEGELPTHTGNPHFLKKQLIEVVVVGKVKHPGTYQIEKARTVADVISLAEPLETASLKRLKLESQITRRRKIIVP